MKILRQGQVAERVGLSRTTLWRMERKGLFPHRRRITENVVGWLEEEVDEWLASREVVGGGASREGDDSA
jgi:predicted DNA-binding transcriptional regulator AlpA